MPKQSRRQIHHLISQQYAQFPAQQEGDRLQRWGCPEQVQHMPDEIEVGDVVRLRKAHPCGSHDWEVVRVGADIGIKCLKCQRKVFLERGVFRRRLKAVVGKKE